MAKEKKNNETNKDYDAWSNLHNIKSKAEYDGMRKVRDFFERSKNYLRSSCYWDAYQEDNSGAEISGGSWYERWKLQEKMALMWWKKSGPDDWKSNIKSPMARGRINTFVNWIKKVNLEFGAKPNNRDDRNAAFMADKLTNYWMNNSNAKQALGDAWETLAIHGIAYLKLSYVYETRMYRFPKKNGLNEKEKDEVKEGKTKLVYDTPVETTILDDIILEHVPIQEIFPEPQARNLHGDTYRAGKIGRRRYVTLDYFKSLYGDHPNAINVDKVKGSSAYRDMTDYFFEPPTDFMDDNIVQLDELEDQDNDCFYVVANDLPIIGCVDEEPLPNNHKELSYFKLDFIRVPGQWHSIGICDLLDNLQGNFEIGLNMLADYMYRSYNYRLLIEAGNYGEAVQALQRTGDLLIPLDGSDGRALSGKVVPLPVYPIGFDIFNFLELLEKQATLATNIDPAQMALLAGSKTATSDILNKELLMTMIGGVIENNVNGDLRQIGRQLWKLQQQHYTKQKVKEITGDDKKTKKLVNRTIRFDNIEIKLNEDTGLLEEKEIENDYSFFDVTDKYLSTKEEIDIYFKPESKEVQSQSIEEQRMGEEFAQLIPFAVDPNNPQQVMTHPMPKVDVDKLFKEYFSVKRLPQDLLLIDKKDTDKSIMDAEKHIMQILSDEMVSSIPGQSSAHLEAHYQVLDALIFKAEELNKEVQKDIEDKTTAMSSRLEQYYQRDTMTGGFIEPMTGQPIQMPAIEPDQTLMRKLDSVEQKIEALEKHIMIEAMPVSMRNSRIAMMNSSQSMGQPEKGMMQAPMPNGSPESMEISPEMINSMNPAGQVPMGSAPMSPMSPMNQPL